MKENQYNPFNIHEIDAFDDWANSAYDEYENAVMCERCFSEMKWEPVRKVWYCPECESEMDRSTYFAYIGAQPPGDICLSGCCENYPFCKKHCEHYLIDPDDPMAN